MSCLILPGSGLAADSRLSGIPAAQRRAASVTSRREAAMGRSVYYEHVQIGQEDQ